jgi:hypothetical protein
MSTVEIMIVLPADFASHRLRAEGRRYGRHEAEKAEALMREAAGYGMLTDELADRVLLAVDHDIRKTVANLAPQVPAEKRAVFERAARRAIARQFKIYDAAARREGT